MSEEERNEGTGTSKPPETVEALARSLEAVVERIRELQAQSREAGLFVEDRGLLACPQCGLMEDVLASGHLVTYRGSPAGPDTGLRFSEQPVQGGGFTCPGCGGVTWPEKEWDDEDDEDDAGNLYHRALIGPDAVSATTESTRGSVGADTSSEQQLAGEPRPRVVVGEPCTGSDDGLR